MPKKTIAIFTGIIAETWDLDTYKTIGLGGSETSAGRLAETAAAEGHDVTLFGTCERKIQRGVKLVPWREFRPDGQEYDLLIISRDIGWMGETLAAKKVLAWAQDIYFGNGEPLTDPQKRHIDQFIALSPWHSHLLREHYQIPAEKITVIPPGVNIELFSSSDLDKKRYAKFLWSSSPDRGLENLLFFFPWIKEKVPEAHLEVTYGFHNWMPRAILTRNIKMLERIKQLDSYLNDCEYVTFRGRIGQNTLAESFKTAYLWLYPTAFHETYCISAKEAQASSTPIICSKLAALETTVGPYGSLIAEEPYSKEGRRAFVARAVELLKNRELWQQAAIQAHKGIARCSWKERWHEYWEKFLL